MIKRLLLTIFLGLAFVSAIPLIYFQYVNYRFSSSSIPRGARLEMIDGCEVTNEWIHWEKTKDRNGQYVYNYYCKIEGDENSLSKLWQLNGIKASSQFDGEAAYPSDREVHSWWLPQTHEVTRSQNYKSGHGTRRKGLIESMQIFEHNVYYFLRTSGKPSVIQNRHSHPYYQ